MIGFTNKWSWHHWLIVTIRIIWFITALVEMHQAQSIIPIPYWVIASILFFIFSTPLLLSNLSSKLYLISEYILTGTLAISLSFLNPEGIGIISALMIGIGFYSGMDKNYRWSIPVISLIYLVMAIVGQPELQFLLGQTIDFVFLFAIGFIMQALVTSKEQVSNQNKVIKDQYRVLEQYAKQVEQMTTERERNRISGEMHDSVGHTFTSVILGMESLKKHIDSKEGNQKLEQLLEVTRKGLNDVRKTVHELEPLDMNLSLQQKLTNIIDEFKTNTDIEVIFKINGEEETLLPTQVKLTLSRCLQESLTNAVRHGGASLIHVTLKYDIDKVTMKIEDDGKGTEELRLGFGLNTMKERIQVLQGDLSVSSFLNKGMTVLCTIPIFKEINKNIIKIAIVDDDPVVCESLEGMLSLQEDLEVIGSAKNGIDAIQLCNEQNPDILLMDIHMGVMNGVEAAKKIKAQTPSVRIIMITTFDEIDYAVEAIQAGAEGYLLKSTPPKELVSKIRLVYLGETIITQRVAKRMIEHLNEKKADVKTNKNLNNYDLTERELEVLQCLAEGLKYKGIAEKLYLAEGTVRNYISNIYSKLEVSNRDQAAKKAIDEGIVATDYSGN